VNADARYSVGELADLGGVTRRTVRYYVQEGLLPPPLGVGRGRHYDSGHLTCLLRVKAMQEEGLPLTEIRRKLSSKSAASQAPGIEAVSRSAWTRLALAPGVELHVSSEVRLPSPGKLGDLAEWCRRYFRKEEESEE